LPAALQGIENPVPRVKHPDWLEAEKRKKLDMTLQPRINEFFKASLLVESGRCLLVCLLHILQIVYHQKRKKKRAMCFSCFFTSSKKP
jgi:hypothetical protein